MNDFSKQLYEFVYSLGTIDPKLLEEAWKESVSGKIPFDQLLFQKDLLPDEALGKIMADLYNLPFIQLSQTSIPGQILFTIPELVAKKHRIIAFNKDAKGLHVAFSNPLDTAIQQMLYKKTGLPLMMYFATERDITNALSLYAKDVTQTFEDLLKQQSQNLKNKTGQDSSIVKIAEEIIRYGYRNKASDIHIEPENEETVVRFRIDGILHDIIHLPRSVHDQIVTRVKVMARLRTDEHQTAQDGKIIMKFEKEELDLRVSIVPIVSGEKIVLRLLSEYSRQFSLHELGFNQNYMQLIESAYSKPHGMLLSTGPTGSGKTTTLYAILKLLNKRSVNIMTIEDPVEYDIQGINQIQVNTKTNLTFAAGLKSIVRQDPDIILVGEIRDEETAGIAINSAMTGHLVLSTLHTNDAATTLPRLLDMGIEPFLIASTINVIIAQRLVRTICTKCRVSYEFNNVVQNSSRTQKTTQSEVLSSYFPQGVVRLYKGKGCNVCHNSGFLGRVGVFEILVMNDTIKQAVMEQKNATVIKQLAVENGMKTMIEDGVDKIKEGITTLEEVLRVTTD